MTARVLVVDDSAVVRELIAVNLELEGLEVVQCVDGLEALERIAEQRPDAITLDVMMPRLDGFSTVERLRADPTTAESPSSSSPVVPRQPTWPGGRRSAWTPTSPSRSSRPSWSAPCSASSTCSTDPPPAVPRGPPPAGGGRARRYPGAVTPEQLSTAIVGALTDLVGSGALALPDGVPGHVVVERPKSKEHGDYATNVALQLAKKAGLPPRDLAGLLAERLGETEGIASVEIAGPGFLNIRVEAGAQGALAAQIVEAGAAYGANDALAGQTVQRRVHLGQPDRSDPPRAHPVGRRGRRPRPGRRGGRGAEVTREFYINDRGNQMDKFGASMRPPRSGKPVPEDGYDGDYIAELAAQIISENPHILDLPEGERLVAFREAGYKIQLAEQQHQLEDFRTHFDVWYSERSLHDGDKVQHGLDKLAQQGHLFEEEGALWMRTTDFGDDKDRVLRRGNGELTYFASDTAYYVDKRERGSDVCIYLLGADHHGYVGRLKAMAACAGDDPEHNIEVLIGQLVKIMRGGEEIRLSKRAGAIVTLQELVEMIGVDALRYTLSRYPADSPLTLDVEQITRQASDNPVFYVQYAHARLASIVRNGADLGVTSSAFDPSLLSHEKEGELLRALAEFPRVVATAATLREPHRVARYLEATAGSFHRFYDACRVLPMGDEAPAPIHAARLVLVEATKTVLANGLRLLGVSAPERM